MKLIKIPVVIQGYSFSSIRLTYTKYIKSKYNVR